MGGMGQNHCRKPQVLQDQPGTSFETKVKWKIEMVFQTLIIKNFRDKEIHHYPSQQGWVLLLF